MKWDPVLNIDETFNNLRDKTLILYENEEDTRVLEDFKFIHTNNELARVDFTSGVRSVVTKEQIEIAKELSKKITNIMKLMAEKYNGHLEGLEFKIKSEDSLNRKLKDADNGFESGFMNSSMVKRKIESTHDILRFTVVYDADYFIESFFDSRIFLNSKGMDFVKIKNTFGAKDTYKGVNTFVLAKDEEYNYIFELQFHTQQSYNAKDKTHEYYEIERSSESSEKEKIEAQKAQARIFSAVEPPENFEFIKEIDLLRSNEVGVI